MGLEVESLGKKLLISVPRRMFNSLLPHEACFNKIQADMVGPSVLFIMLWVLIEVFRMKDVCIEPIILFLLYFFIITPLTYLLLKAGMTSLSMFDILSLIGYAQFGHFCILVLAIIFRSPDSNIAFFLPFTLFGGCSSVRLVVIFAFNSRKPIFSLLAGSLSCIAYLLLILFSYFLYIPPKKFMFQNLDV